MESLPRELFELVLGSMSESDDKTTLLNCCLVSRAFCAISQPLLFTTVDLASNDAPGALRRLTSFQNAVSCSPFLSNYINSASICCRMTLRSPEDPWEATTAALIPALSHVRDLALTHPKSMTWWSPPNVDLASPVCEALSLHWTSFVNLTELSLKYILSFPFHFVASPNLRSLYLDWVTSSRAPSEEYTPPHPAASIDTLRVKWFEADDFDQTAALIWFLRRSRCPVENLEFIGLPQSRDEQCSTFQMIELITPLASLKHLVIEKLDGYITNNELHSFELCTLPALRHFRTSLSHEDASHEKEGDTVFSWLTNQLHGLPFEHPLVSIEMVIPLRIEPPFPSNPRGRLSDLDDWDAFDVALLAAQKRRLTLLGAFEDEKSSKEAFFYWKSHAEKLLPRSKEMGVFNIDYTMNGT
ncbi:hypothetical protein DL96DRAFT_1628557 [Flagelloscypha sp. PMI_526]|nr:hypothetical protein DL96DRAFT_1628557 [Flagelloscypha sp. PMI_526]